MNGVFTFVFLVVLTVMCAGVARTWILQRAKNGDANEELAEALDKISQLEERVRVLERIVTENRADLRQQIDSL